LKPYIIYGYELSYFTRKMERAFSWHGFAYQRKSKTLNEKWRLERRSGTHQVPVVETPQGWYLADTTPISLWLDSQDSGRALLPPGPGAVLVRLIEEYFDEWTARLALHYRWNDKQSAKNASRRLAKEMAPWAPAFVQDKLGAKIADWGRRAVRALGLDSAAQQAVGEEELRRVYEALEQQLSHTRFALGDRPTIVDAVILGGLDAHFAVDRVCSEMLEAFPRIRQWQKDAGKWDGEGDFPIFPETTPFGDFILKEMSGNYQRFIEGNAQALSQEQKAFKVEIGGSEVSYLARRYPDKSRLMISEFIDRCLNSEEKASVQTWLGQKGLEAVLDSK
jgi:glutathione S-transferase